MEVAAHIVVDGLVQGVGFRYFVSLRAQRLSLRGYVKNLPDSRVEIVAEGDRSAIESLLQEVKVGPRAAQVRDVRVDWLPPGSHYEHFSIQ